MKLKFLMAPESAPASPATPPAAPATPPAAPAAAPSAPATALTAPPAAPAAPATALTAEPAAPATPGAPQTGEPKAQTPAPADIQIKVPEGVKVDQGLIDGFTAFAKENKISQESAQKYVDAFLAGQQKSTAAAQQAANDQKMAEITQWAEDAKNDPEIGGVKFDATLAAGRKALQRFGSPGLTKILNETGLGNHKEVIRLFAQVGSKISEDRLPGGPAGQGGEGAIDPTVVLYPTMQPK